MRNLDIPEFASFSSFHFNPFLTHKLLNYAFCPLDIYMEKPYKKHLRSSVIYNSMKMKFDKNLASIHGYLCGDGYVITNPSTQKKKYYYIGFRNMDTVLLLDFQKKFKRTFGIKPIVTQDGRCKTQNKEIYSIFTKNHSYYSYEWRIPSLSKDQMRWWLRAFFDCEAWVENQPGKSRLIGLDCCNKEGLFQVQRSLEELRIKSKIHKKKGRTIWRLTICGLDNIRKFKRNIGFLHPNKKEKLNAAIGSYVNYDWDIPKIKRNFFFFMRQKGRTQKKRDEIRFHSIKKQNLIELSKALKKQGISSKVFGPWKNNSGSTYYCLTTKKSEVINVNETRN